MFGGLYSLQSRPSTTDRQDGWRKIAREIPKSPLFKRGNSSIMRLATLSRWICSIMRGCSRATSSLTLSDAG